MHAAIRRYAGVQSVDEVEAPFNVVIEARP